MPHLLMHSLATSLPRGAFFLLCIGLVGACGTMDGSSSQDADSYERIGYVFRGQGTEVSAQAARQLTHINYAFANVTEDGRVVLESSEDSTTLSRLTALRSANPDLKVLLAVGGWAWSDYFSNAALTDSARTRFARSAANLVDEHDLDGLDIDWEYPGQPGQNNVYRPEDKKNFTRLLQTVRRHLDDLPRREGRPDESYLLTVAAAANSSYLEHTNMSAVQKELDFVNLMTYDFHGPWTAHTGHHANLYPPASPDTVQRSAATAVDRFVDAGVPPGKIVLGVPFYGRGWRGVRSQNNGLYQPYAEPHGAFPYDSLAHHLVGRHGFTRHWDEGARAPYLWNSDSSIVITYEDPESLRAKAEFVASRGLGGIMYWEHSDDDGTLLNTLYKHLR